jgi:hypothetical protein
MPIRPTDSLQDIAQGSGAEPLKIQAQPGTPTLPRPDFFLLPEAEATLEQLQGTKAWAAGAGWQTPEAVRQMFGINSPIEKKPAAK